MEQRGSARLRAAVVLVVVGASTVLSACGLILGFDEFDRVEGERPEQAFTTSGQGGAGGETPAVTTGGGMGGAGGMGGSGGTLLTNGSPCAMGAECSSALCVDGVCCDTACDTLCTACTAALKSFGADGVCEPIVGGNDPQDECADETGTNACGQNGSCDGSGACQLVAINTSCGVMTGCMNGVESGGDFCDGTGTCMQGNTTACDPYVCEATGALCLVTCAGSTDCLSTHFCAGNTCVMDKSNGQACLAAHECQSGFCVDGFCCNTACSGLCQACAAALTPSQNGVCANIDAGLDPANECANPSDCVLGNCNGTGMCANQNAPNGTPCSGGNGFCSGGICTGL